MSDYKSLTEMEYAILDFFADYGNTDLAAQIRKDWYALPNPLTEDDYEEVARIYELIK